MAYNRKFLLRKIIEIQSIYLKYTEKGCTAKWIYEHLICDNYHISQRTFENYLGVNAKKELKELENNLP